MSSDNHHDGRCSHQKPGDEDQQRPLQLMHAASKGWALLSILHLGLHG